MTKIFRLILPLCAVLVLAVAPMMAQAQDTPAPVRIGMVNYTLCCAYFIGMSQAVEAEAAVYPNVEIVVTDANGDIAKMTSDVEDVLAQGVDGIIISGGPIEAAPAALDAIEAAGVPVVLVDRLLAGENYTSWIGPDNYLIGQQVGAFIAERLGDSGRVVILRGGPADNSIGLNRTNGVTSELEGTGIEVSMAPDFGDWSEDGGFTLMEDMLTQYADISAVFCENDSMCLGAQRAIADAGRSEEMFITGVDGQKEAVLQILNGSNYVATGMNNSDQIGRAAFNRMMAILAGAQAPQQTVVPSPLITSENAIKFYNPDSVF
jgi:ribose transport system substrate-binding protein